jgi:type IV secretion system protein VirD4
MSADFSIPYGYNAARGTFPSYTDNRHLCTFGPNRSGKAATVIVQTLLTAPHSMVVIDPKGQLAAVTGRRRREMGHDVYVLNPFGLHTGEPWNLPQHRYNPLAHLRITDRNIVADTAALSQALIITQGREPYFDDTARDLVTTTALYLIDTMAPKATLAGVRKIVAEIGAREKEGAGHLVAMGRSRHAFIRQPIGRFRDAEARDISSSINTSLTQLAFLDDPALTDPDCGTLTGNDFNLMQLKRRPTTVYIILPGRYMESYARYLRLIITSALDQLTSEPGGYPVLFILDEFARLQNLPAISSAFGFAAGFNVQLWPFLQDMPQLEDVYGKRWMSILANCGLTQFFTPVDVQTAEYLQRRGGQTTGQSRSKTYSGMFWKKERSESRSEQRRPLLPFEITMSLPGDQSLVFFAGAHEPLRVGRVPYWKIPRLAGMYDPDPYHQ